MLCGIIIMFDMSIESFAELASFLSPLLGVPAQEITPEKRLFHDFGIDGDDLLEILLPLRDKHGLDISDFDPTPYFGYELVAGYRHAFHRLTSFRYCALLPFRSETFIEQCSRANLRVGPANAELTPSVADLKR